MKALSGMAFWLILVCSAQAMTNGVAVPGFSASLGYFDTYRRAHVPANLVQASLPSMRFALSSLVHLYPRWLRHLIEIASH
jgi:hypothetical protein